MEILDWDSAYRLRPYVENQPHPEVGLMGSLFAKHGVQRVLDLGCGDGRHLVLLAARGFQVFGLDRSFWGLRRSAEWLQQEGLSAGLVQGEMTCLPWPPGFFDAVISIQVINHNRLSGMIRTLEEVHRVLCEAGYFYGTLARYNPAVLEDPRHEVIEPRTFVRLEGFEKGIPHHNPTEVELDTLLSSFDVLTLGEDTFEPSYFSFLAQK